VSQSAYGQRDVFRRTKVFDVVKINTTKQRKFFSSTTTLPFNDDAKCSELLPRITSSVSQALQITQTGGGRGGTGTTG